MHLFIYCLYIVFPYYSYAYFQHNSVKVKSAVFRYSSAENGLAFFKFGSKI